MTPRQVFRALPPWAWKVLSAFVGVVGVVWALGLTFGEEWSGIPAQVRANTASISAHERVLRDLLRSDSIIIAGQRRQWCAMTLPESVTPAEYETRCRP